MTNNNWPSSFDCVVIGAGIVGASTALALQRDGRRVVLVDRQEPGQGCSFGNAGLLHSGGCIPMAAPGTLGKVPKMLMDKQGALRIPWSYLPRLTPWLFSLVRQATDERIQHNISALSALLQRARPAYQTLLDHTALQNLVATGGELHVYRTEEAYRQVEWEMTIRREHGAAVETLTSSELHDLEPALAESYRFAWHLPKSDYVVSPVALVQGFVQSFQEHGGHFVRGEARDITPIDGGGVTLQTEQGQITAPKLVLCTGAWSADVASKLGSKVPLEALRGYHVVVPETKQLINRVVVDGEKHIAVSRMNDGMRIAGIVEMAGLKRSPDPRLGPMLLGLAQDMLNDFPTEISSEWTGYRPGTPDSLPVIGPSPKCKDVYFAYGHGQLGLTFAAVTGELVADMVAGRASDIDLHPYRANRF